jgi:Abnormal spindle-like microcephaly-assoc'd, ASPM-SPD-2-Hydin/Beta-propeller repeat
MCPLKLRRIVGAVFLIALSSSILVFKHAPQRSSQSVFGSSVENRVAAREMQRGQNPNAPIDPVLLYSTYLGGASLGAGAGTTAYPQGITASYVDGAGNLYVVGATSAADFPVTAGVIQPTNTQNNQVGFLSKLDPTGQTLLFSTYLFGMGSASSIAMDASGNIYVAGIAPTSNPTVLPIPPGTTPFNASPRDISIIKLNSTATAVLNATYFGGSGIDTVTGLAVDANGNIYLSGQTTSNDFPTQNPIQSALGSSGASLFVSKFNSMLSSLTYSTYLGGYNINEGVTASRTVAVDAAGDAYVVGSSLTGFPTTPGAYQSTCASSCAVLAKFNPSGAALLYSTYLGAGKAYAVIVDSSQNVYLAGSAAAGFPEVNSLQSCGAAGSSDGYGFVSEISAAGALTFSTCLGQSTEEMPVVGPPQPTGITDLVLDGSGNVYLIGGLASTATLPLLNPIQANTSTSNLFVAAINPTAASLLFSSLIEGGALSSPNSASSIGLDSNDNIFVSGFSGACGYGTCVPAIPIYNALQPTPGLENPNFPCHQCEQSDGFIMKIAPTNAPAAALMPSSINFAIYQPALPIGTASTAMPITIVNMSSGSTLAVSNASVTGDFSIQNGCTSVAPVGGTCTIQVTFTPTAVGTRTGVLTIIDNSAGSPQTVQLSGVGGQGAVGLSPTSLSFSSQLLNTTSTAQTVTLTNTGLLALNVSRVQVTAPFAETNTCGTSVVAGGSCTISVTFTPTAAGATSGTLTLTDSAADSPQSVPLSGVGVTPTLGLGVASGSSSSATVTAGSSATYGLSIGGKGMSGSASLSCTGPPAESTCSVPPTESVSGTTASNFKVSVTTTAPTQAAAGARPHAIGTSSWALAFAFFGMFFLPKARRRRLVIALLCLVPLCIVLLSSCGGGSSTPPPQKGGTPAGTYTLKITATLGSATQTQNLTLTVQ